MKASNKSLISFICFIPQSFRSSLSIGIDLSLFLDYVKTHIVLELASHFALIRMDWTLGSVQKDTYQLYRQISATIFSSAVMNSGQCRNNKLSLQIFEVFFRIFSNVNFLFIESIFPDILALCETNLDGSIDSGNFSVKDYLLLLWKNSVTCMHGLAVCVKEEFPFSWNKPKTLCGFLPKGFTYLSF